MHKGKFRGKTSRALLLPGKRDATKAILRYLTDGDIDLKVEEQEILSRLEHCDLLMRQKVKSDDQIVDEIVEKFGVSVHTARNDIYKAQNLFAKARTINKKYLIHHHIQRIDRDIQLVRSKLFRKSAAGDLIIPDNKEMQALAKLYDSYTYALNSAPEEQNHEAMPPPVFQFVLAPGQIIENNMSIEDAISKADEIILSENKDGIYEQQQD